MRVLFIGDKLEPTSGSAQKVVAMATEWERAGHSVWLATARTPLPRRASDVAERMRTPPPVRHLPERILGEASVRLLYPQVFAQFCARLEIDLIYSRGLPPAPGLRAMIRRVPFVLEINGDVGNEISQPWRRRARLRSRALQLGNADGVVFVSRALKAACKPEPKRSIVLANPCLPTERSNTDAPPPTRPTLVMIGYAKHGWSGMDKVVELAKALPDLDFVVIGTQFEALPNLRSYPLLAQQEADRVMSTCTVGIGPLALYRKDMHEASPLKSRNYLALGLPIIQAYEDTDLSEQDGCILSLPNREDNVQSNLERIREFAWRAFRDPGISASALALARGRLSLAHRERERLAFIETCLHSRPVR